MPKLSAVLNDETYNGLDDSLKTFYVQNSDTKDWWLDVDEPGKLDVAGSKELERLRGHNKTVLGEKKTVAEKLAAYEALGKTADEIKAALEANQPEAVTKLVADYEAKIKQLTESYEGPMSELKAANEKLLGEQDQAAVRQAIQKAIRDHDLNEMAEFVLPTYLKPVRDENGVSVRVFENGAEAMIAGQPKSLEQLLKGFQDVKAHPQMFNAGNGGGTGATNRQAGLKDGAKTIKRSDWEQRQRRGENLSQFFADGGKVVDD